MCVCVGYVKFIYLSLCTVALNKSFMCITVINVHFSLILIAFNL